MELLVIPSDAAGVIMEFAGKLGQYMMALTCHAMHDRFACSADIMVEAAAIGSLKLIEWGESHKIKEDHKGMMAGAVAGGHIEIAKRMVRQGKRRYYDAGIEAARTGQVEIFQWALTGNVSGWEWRLLHEAIAYGQLNVISWAHTKGYKPNDLCDIAADNGHLHVLKWAHKIGGYGTGTVCRTAAGKGYFEIVKWAHKKRYIWESICWHAAHGGHFDILKYAYENGAPLQMGILHNAAYYGRIDMLEWLLERGCPQIGGCTECDRAASGGHLDTLKWLQERGFQWGRWTIASAARRGHLEVIKYLRENGCPWDESTCSEAAEGGHFEVFKYAVDNGCPCDEAACNVAVRGRHYRIVAYAILAGKPYGEKISIPLNVKTAVWLSTLEEQ